MARANIRRELVSFVELLAITGFAIGQPVLDVFAKTPEQFVFRGASTGEIVAFPFIVVLAPAVVLWLPSAVARRVSETAGAVVHEAAIGIGLFAGLLQIAHVTLGTGGLPKAIVAAVGAGVGVLLYRRFVAARTWTRFMALYPPVLIALFLFASPAGDLALREPPAPVELALAPSPVDADRPPSDDPADDELPPVVMIVLDELPTALLLDASGAIDPVRYPVLSAFAADATWYRTYTTVSAQTLKAIPSLLSGQLPDDAMGASWTQQPDNLFRLLGGTYHLTVSESVTRLCPEEWCGETATPPPPAARASASDADAATTASVTELPAEEHDRGGLGRLLDDAVDVWRAQIALDREDVPVQTGFEESIADRPAPAGPVDPAPTTSAPPTSAPRAIDAPPVTDEEAEAVEDDLVDDWFSEGLDRVAQLPRVAQFRSTIRPSDTPTLYYLHLLLPHQPFFLMEEGSIYAAPSVGDTLPGEWETSVLAERMSLQLRFTEQLVGDVLTDLRDAGVYDDALVIVTSDHGASLDRSTQYRYYDGTNAADLMVTPLLVKLPGQTEGAVSDVPVETVDILPTIADVLGIEVPWEVDGSSVIDRRAPVDGSPCTDIRHYVRFGRGRLEDDDGTDRFEVCAEDILGDGLRPILGELRSDDELATAGLSRLTPHGELVGRRWSELDARAGDAATVTLAPTATTAATPATGQLDGTVDGGTGTGWVAVAIDDRIIGVAPIHRHETDTGAATTGHFTVLVPSALLDERGYAMRVALLDTVDGRVVATELTLT